MSIKAEFAFDCSWEIYQCLKAEQEGIGILDPGSSSDHSWRPRTGASNAEFITDFQLAARAPFKSSQDASRRILVELFYVGLIPYHQARNRIGITEYMWSVWADEVREKVGSELMRRGIWPPKRYFGERTRPSRHAKQISSRQTAQMVR